MSTRTSTSTYPSPDPNALDVHISLLCPFTCGIHLINDLVPSQIVPDDVSEFPALKSRSATVDGEHDDLLFAREVMMPVASETNIGRLRVGSAVPKGGLLARSWRNAVMGSYGFSKTGYFFLPEVSRLGGIVSITLSTARDQCQFHITRFSRSIDSPSPSLSTVVYVTIGKQNSADVWLSAALSAITIACSVPASTDISQRLTRPFTPTHLPRQSLPTFAKARPARH